MGTLTNCLKKIGLAEHEAAIIKGYTQEHLAFGHDAYTAADQALRQYQDELDTEYKEIVAEIRKQLPNFNPTGETNGKGQDSTPQARPPKTEKVKNPKNVKTVTTEAQDSDTPEVKKAKEDLKNALSDLGQFFLDSGLLSKKAVPNAEIDEAKLVPILTRVLDAVFSLGYHTFKQAARQSLDLIREHFGDAPADSITIDHLQGAYIAMAGKYKGKGADNKKDVIAFESLDELYDSPAKTPTETLADDFLSDRQFKTIVDARKRIEEITGKKIEAGTEEAKRADEMIEAAAVLAARQIVATGKSPEAIFDALVRLTYHQMPNLSVRTSTSVAQQAYSTPLPLAYVASQRAGITPETTVTEPTAGNGALLIAANPEYTVANELNPDRAQSLRNQGFEVYTEDATKMDFGKNDSDVVIANPPFGVVKDADGNSVTFQINNQYSTNEVDHAISLNVLKSMKDDGRAVLIIGGPAKTLSDAGRSNAYNGKAKRAFFYTLYNEYNVTDHFTMSGDLYAKQGAAWPVDVIVIEGRGKSALKLPAASLPRIINNIEELKNELYSRRPGEENNGNRNESESTSDSGTGQKENDVQTGETTAPSGNGERSPDGQPPGIRGGSGGKSESTGPVSDSLANDSDKGIRNSGGTGTGSDTGQQRVTEKPKNAYQTPYKPASSARSVDTLVPANMRTAVESALEKLVAEHGNVDQYVADQLGYAVDQIPNYFSAEQVDALALALDNMNKGKGFIIGDQTGVGKGRVVAGVIRYAIKNGRTPIFVTEKPNLYGDMLRDLNDIGMPEVKPVVTNSGFDIPLDDDAARWYEEAEAAKANGERAPARYGEFMKTPAGAKHAADLRKMADNGKLDGYDVIFTTYNQMQTVKGQRTDRMDFLEAFANGGVVIFDESHNAGGGQAKQGRGKGQQAEQGEKTGRAGFSRAIAKLAHGVFYSSATYAKRPEVMDLYFKTDMGMSSSSGEELANALNAGGVPLQQVVASMLAQAGQYIRREKSFDGIDYMTVPAEVDKEFAENAATIMRDIMKFDKLKQAALAALDDEIKAGAIKLTNDGSTGGAGAQSSNFTSVMHNLIAQMLLTLKVKPTIHEALEALGRNEKPVIALANTMGSAIEEYVKDTGLNPGDAIGLSFGDLLKRYLSKSRRVIEGDPYGKKTVRYLTDEELGPTAKKFYDSVVKKIDSMNFNDVPISPIDAIRHALAEKGYVVGEITGRGAIIDYSGNYEEIEAVIPTTFKTSENEDDVKLLEEYATKKKDKNQDFMPKGTVATIGDATVVVVGDKKTLNNGEDYSAVPVLDKKTGEVFVFPTAFVVPTGETEEITKDYQTELNRYRKASKGGSGLPIYRRRGAEETKTAGKRKTINDFNSGKMDAIILNQSGATGLSLHASEKFADKRKRFMIVTQPELNIDTHMQMLGRINRTGQVVLPHYAQLVADIPAEKRPASILSKKMAMLNANTTASRDSAVKAKDTPDFMNEYGDEVVAQLMNDNPEWHGMIGAPLPAASNGDGLEKEGAMRKVTGRIPILSLKDQERFYAAIEDAYNELIDTLNRTGQNGLEAKVLALDAKVKESVEVSPKTNDSGSPFAEAVVANIMDIKRVGKPMTIDQIKDILAKNVGAETFTSDAADAFVSKQLKQLEGTYHQYRKSIADKLDDADEKERKSIDAQLTKIDAQYERVMLFMAHRLPGSVVTLKDFAGAEYPGYVGKFERKGMSDNPFAAGTWKLTVYVADAAKQITIPLSKINQQVMNPGLWNVETGAENILKAFEEGQSESREDRTILTGNILGGFGAFRAGQIINFTDHEGNMRQGIMMPRKFSLEEENKKRPVVFKNTDQAFRFITSRTGARMMANENGDVRISSGNGYRYTLAVPQAKGSGGRYFLNRTLLDALGRDFVKTGGTMQASIFDDDTLRRVMDILSNMGDKFVANSHKDEARAFIEGESGAKQSRAVGKTGSSTVASIRQELTDSLGGTVAALEQDGILKIAVAPAGTPANVTAQIQHGKITLYSNRIAPGQAIGKLLHETGGHGTLKEILGDDFDRQAAYITKLAEQGDKHATVVERHVQDLIQRGELDQADADEERIAYSVEYAANERANGLTAKFKLWLARVMAKIRAYVYQSAIYQAASGLGIRMNLTPHDLAALARASLNKAATGTSELSPDSNNPDIRYSRSRTPEEKEFFRKANIAQQPPSLIEQLRDFYHDTKTAISEEFEQKVFNKYAAIDRAEKAIHGDLPAEQSGYIATRLSSGASSVMHHVLTYGAVRFRQNDVAIEGIPGSKSFIEIMRPIKDDLDSFVGWMVARRALRLRNEGKENLFTLDDIRAGLLMVKPGFTEVANELAALNKQMLDMAEQAGLIDSTTRRQWERDDYIPFYRMMEDDRVKSPKGKRGLSHQTSGIRQLKGGTSMLADPLGNYLANWAHLIDASMKNRALIQVVDNLKDSPFMQAAPRAKVSQAIVPNSQIKTQLINLGYDPIEIDNLPATWWKGMGKLMALKANDDPNVVRVMREGKTEYYKVADRLLLESLKEVTALPLGGPLRFFRWFSKMLTRAVTATPAFMAANFMRDSLHNWVISEHGFRLGLDSIQGTMNTFKEGDAYRAMLAGGSSFEGGYVNANDPNAVGKVIRNQLRIEGITGDQAKSFISTVMDTPKKWWTVYREIGNAIENANRDAVFRASLRSTGSETQALYDSKDSLDFSLHGSSVAVKILSDSLPFFNARLQGQYKLYRAGAMPKNINPMKFFGMNKLVVAKGMMLSAATIILLAYNWDNDRYKELPDWDKDSYWHLFTPYGHFRIPKPFEVGFFYGTLVERSTRAIFGADDFKKLAARIGSNAFDQLAFNPIPQAIKPVAELITNKDSYTWTDIENMGDEGKLPLARYNEQTSPTMREISELLPDWLGASPKRLEHLVKGYTGTIGLTVLAGTDVITRQIGNYPTQPSMRVEDYPLIGRFVRAEPALSTQDKADLFAMAREAEEIYKTITAFAKQGKIDEAQATLQEDMKKLQALPILRAGTDALSETRKLMDAIIRSSKTPEQKRIEIDALLQRSNEVAKEISDQARPAFR